jgi:hypothetical protein
MRTNVLAKELDGGLAYNVISVNEHWTRDAVFENLGMLYSSIVATPTQQCSAYSRYCIHVSVGWTCVPEMMLSRSFSWYACWNIIGKYVYKPVKFVPLPPVADGGWYRNNRIQFP